MQCLPCTHAKYLLWCRCEIQYKHAIAWHRSLQPEFNNGSICLIGS